MVGHDNKNVELKLALVSVAEERFDEKFGDGVALEDATSLVADDGEGVGLGLEAHSGRACPGG